ncbi:MAG TPA: hypothetical protein VGM77_03540 [Gemmatimonadales bacterium]|jgi:hypothetical protein
MKARSAALGVMVVAACYPTTTRPPFTVEPTAATTQIELPIDRATTALALALDTDSIPVLRTVAKDGWLETGWFDATTMQPTTARVLGPAVVKVRGFVDPARPNFSALSVETVYRPMADPAMSARDLEREVPADHPVAKRVQHVLAAMVKQYGGVPDSIPALDQLHHVGDSLGTNLLKRKRAMLDSLPKSAPDTTVATPPVPVKPVPVDTTLPHKPRSTAPATR